MTFFVWGATNIDFFSPLTKFFFCFLETVSHYSFCNVFALSMLLLLLCSYSFLTLLKTKNKHL